MGDKGVDCHFGSRRGLADDHGNGDLVILDRSGVKYVAVKIYRQVFNVGKLRYISTAHLCGCDGDQRVVRNACLKGRAYGVILDVEPLYAFNNVIFGISGGDGGVGNVTAYGEVKIIEHDGGDLFLLAGEGVPYLIRSGRAILKVDLRGFAIDAGCGIDAVVVVKQEGIAVVRHKVDQNGVLMSGQEFLGFVHDRAGVVVTVAEPDDTVDLPVTGVGACHGISGAEAVGQIIGRLSCHGSVNVGDGDALHHAVVALTEVILHGDIAGGILIVCLDHLCRIVVDICIYIGHNGRAVIVEGELIAVVGADVDNQLIVVARHKLVAAVDLPPVIVVGGHIPLAVLGVVGAAAHGVVGITTATDGVGRGVALLGSGNGQINLGYDVGANTEVVFDCYQMRTLSIYRNRLVVDCNGHTV